MRPALPLALVALFAAGCTGGGASNSAEDFKGEEKRVAQVVDDLAAAGRGGDAKEICTSILDRRLVARLGDCQAVIDDQLSDADVFDLEVKSVRVTGATATATVETTIDGEDKPATLGFTREGQAWRISSLG